MQYKHSCYQWIILYKIPSDFTRVGFTACLCMQRQNLPILLEEPDLINLHNVVKEMTKYTTFLKSGMKKIKVSEEM